MGDKGGGKLHRLVFCQFDIIDLGEGEDAEFFLANGFSARLREEFLFEFFADLLFELFFDDRLGGFARTIAGELGEFGIVGGYGVPDAAHLVGTEFDAQGGDAVWKVFDDDIHISSGKF